MSSATDRVFEISWSGGTIAADLAISIDFETLCEATEFPISGLAVASDHIRKLPHTIEVELFQTQTPLDNTQDERMVFEEVKLDVRKSLFKPGGFLAATAAIGEGIAAIGSALGFGGGGGKPYFVWRRDSDADRVRELHDNMLAAIDKKELVTVIYKGKKYENLVILRCKLTENDEGEFGSFGMSFKQIRKTVAKSALGLPNPADLALKDIVKAGLKPKKETPEGAENKVRKSLLKQLKDGDLGDLLG